MKNIRKLKKYGTAVAGTALLVGATLTGAAAQTGGSSGSSTTLGDFPQPFVDDEGNVQSSIVVGEDAATADVVGAIDIAGVVGQDAFTTETVETGVSVDGKTYEETEVRSLVNDGNADLLDKSDFSKLRRATVEDSEGTEHFVVERAGLDPDNSGSVVGTTVNNTNVLTTIDSGALDYEVNYAPGFAHGEEAPLLGEEYEITGFSTSSGNEEVSLGSTVTQDQLALDETYEHGPYTVKIEDFNQEQSTVLVQISKDGEQLKMQGVGTSGEVSVDDGDFTVTADSIYFGSQGNYITISSTYTDTVLTETEEFPGDEDYTVSSIEKGTNDNGNTTLQSVELTNQLRTSSNPSETSTEDDIERLEEGDEFAGPKDYFRLSYEGLTEESTEAISFGEDAQVEFTDATGLEASLSLGNLVSGDSITSVSDSVYTGVQNDESQYLPIEVTDITKDSGNITSVTVSYNSFEHTYNFDGSTDYKGSSEATTAQERNTAESGSTINADDVEVGSPVSQNFVFEKDTDGNQGDYTINVAGDNENQAKMGVQGFGSFGSGSVDYSNVDVTLNYQLDVNNGANVTDLTLSGGGQSANMGANTYIDSNGQHSGSLTINGADLVSGTSNIQAQFDMNSSNGGTVTVDHLNFSVSSIDSSSADPGTLYTYLSPTTNNLASNEGEVEFETVSSGSGSGGQTTSTGYGFDLSLRFQDTDGNSNTAESINVDNSAAKVHTQYGAVLSGDSSTATLTEANGDTVSVNYDGSSVDSVDYTADDSTSSLTDTDGAEALTDYTSEVSLDSDSSVTVDYPENQRYAVHTVGTEGEATGEGTVSTPAGWPSTGALDTEADTDQNLILVGGPAINDLTQDLAENNQTWSANEWQTGGHEGTSILQLTEGFDGEGGNKALVVAGHGAEDTRTASEFLANYGDHSDALEGESQVTISTETGNVVE